MPTPIFPALKGIGYPVTKRPVFNPIINQSVSGIEVRVQQYGAPLYEWDIPFNWLSQTVAIADFQALWSLYMISYGSTFNFLYSDPTDNTTANVTGGNGITIGTGDGTTVAFQLLSADGWPVYDVNSIAAAPQIYLNGVLQGSGYSINAAGVVTFGSAPGAGVVVSSIFQYYWRARFLDPNQEFDNFASQLWMVKKLTLRQVRQAG